MDLIILQILIGTVNSIVGIIRIILARLTGKDIKPNTDEAVSLKCEFSDDRKISVVIKNDTSSKITVTDISARSGGDNLPGDTCPCVKILPGSYKTMTFYRNVGKINPVIIRISYKLNGSAYTKEITEG